MRVLVLGGIRSGKSEWAESIVADAVQPVRYVATGPVGDDDAWADRISTHRARRPPHWSTVETTNVTAQLRIEALPTPSVSAKTLSPGKISFGFNSPEFINAKICKMISL